MKIQKVQVTGAEGSTVDCGYFSNALYDTYLQLTTTAEIGKQYNIHGYIRSNKSGTIRCQDVTANVTTSWQEIKMTIIPTSNILELYFYPGEFYLYKWKMEAGTISSSWTPSPLDVKYDLIEMGTIVTQLSNSISSKVWQNDINTATGALDTKITEVKQNADKVSWLVKSGSSESDMVLTDTAYTLISKNINLKGNTVFTSFLNDDQTAINGGKIATNSITASQLSTDSIKSRNYIKNSTGSFLNLADGSFDSKYLKWDSTGAITATSGNIAGFLISDNTISNTCDNTYNIIIKSSNNVTDKCFAVYGKNNEPNWYVENNGHMYANNVELAGSFTTKGIGIGNDGTEYTMVATIVGGEVKITNTNNSSYFIIQGHGIFAKNSQGIDTLKILSNTSTGTGDGLWIGGSAGTEVAVTRDSIDLYWKPDNVAWTHIGKGKISICSSGMYNYSDCALSVIGGTKTDSLVVVDGEIISGDGALALTNSYGYSLIIQGDGNLVLYHGDSAIWSSETSGM